MRHHLSTILLHHQEHRLVCVLGFPVGSFGRLLLLCQLRLLLLVKRPLVLTRLLLLHFFLVIKFVLLELQTLVPKCFHVDRFCVFLTFGNPFDFIFQLFDCVGILLVHVLVHQQLLLELGALRRQIFGFYIMDGGLGLGILLFVSGIFRGRKIDVLRLLMDRQLVGIIAEKGHCVN
jgi:hypothetical protein